MSSSLHAPSNDGTANGFRMPRSTQTLTRPTWFNSTSTAPDMAMRHTPLGPTSSSSSSGSNNSLHSTSTLGHTAPLHAFSASPGQNPFTTRHPKHRLSPSPSPNKAAVEEDFVMISPVPQLSPQSRRMTDLSSSPIEESPTPACGMASAAARLRLADEDSPVRGAGAGGAMSRMAPPSPLKFASGSTSIPLLSGEGSPAGMEDDRPIPQPLFPLPRSHSQELRARPIPRLSTSHPLRARASTGSQVDHEKHLGQGVSSKKAISLDRIQAAMADEAFGSVAAPAAALGHARRQSKGQLGPNRNTHKRINSGDHLSTVQASMSRSTGHKSGLALSLGGLPDFSYSNTSLSSLSTNMTPPTSTFSPAEPPIFEDAKPLQEAFEQPSTALRKFKPRDSGVSMGGDSDDKLRIPPSSVLRPSQGQGVGRPRRPPMLKRTSSMGDQHQSRPLETPIEPVHSGWPSSSAFNFLGENGLPLAMRKEEDKLEMPGTPVKRNHFNGGATGQVQGRRGIGHSSSQPSLGSSAAMAFGNGAFGLGGGEGMVGVESGTGVGVGEAAEGRAKVPPMTMRKKSGTLGTLGGVPHLTLTSASGQGASSSPERDGEISPTVRGMMMACQTGKSKLGQGQGQMGMGMGQSPGLLGRMSSGSESDGTPTKGGGGGKVVLSSRPDLNTPSKPPLSTSSIREPLPSSSAHPSKTTNTAQTSTSTSAGAGSIYPRMSLPAFANPKIHRTLHHRQSHPATKPLAEDENIFEARFISLETLGKGAFSTVVKVQERHGKEGRLWAVKKARGVFDGVRDRLRHLEEVDILRHLSSPLSSGPNPHVIQFQDAWEQNRQLFIQTELCLGTLAFFLEEYGRVVERLDEGRVWKIIRELSDGIHHIHSSGVVHFDLKPANILISDVGTLKIGDFGMASRVPRLHPAEILKGAGLGGNAGEMASGGQWEKLEREGDRVYMPPEMLRGLFGMAADIFSFGLVILEVSTNICVPDGGPAWHSLRTDDFSVVDLSPLSPALADLITNCMASDPNRRPTSTDIVGHPVIVRARTGGAALAPESKAWLSGVLGGFDFAYTAGGGAGGEEGDVEMME